MLQSKNINFGAKGSTKMSKLKHQTFEKHMLKVEAVEQLFRLHITSNFAYLHLLCPLLNIK
jgi:hypothetical protein